MAVLKGLRRLTVPMTLALTLELAVPSACGRAGRIAGARSDSGTRTPTSAPSTLPGPLPPPPLPAVETARGTQIALLYSSNLRGEYEHCGCPEHPIGGLVRRATLADRARAESDGVLIVDAGDMLLSMQTPIENFVPPLPSEVERRARLILGAYARMGVHALLPADRDLRIGPAKLKQLLNTFHIPAIASNLTGRAGRPFFELDRMVTIAGVPIGIFGVVQPMEADRALWERWPIRVADPTATARAEVASLRARGAKMIVALLHLGAPGAAAKLLKDVPGITWAVQGHSDQQLETPETIGDARLLEAMSEGKLGGRLDIHVIDGGMTFADKGERAQLIEIIADQRRQLADIERRAAEDKTDQLRDYYKLRREGITAAIVRETEVARKLPAVVHGSWYENRIIPLDESIPDHVAIAQMVAAYNAEGARRAAAGLPVGIEMREPGAPARAPRSSSGSPTRTRATDH